SMFSVPLHVAKGIRKLPDIPPSARYDGWRKRTVAVGEWTMVLRGPLRLLYIVVLGGGLFWTIASRPAWVDPLHAVEISNDPRATERELGGMDEFNRRLKITLAATAAVVVSGELLGFLARRARC